MGDDTTIAVGDRIANDELATLNGVPTTADVNGKLPKAQRVKAGFGADGDFTDVQDTSGKRLPVSDPVVASAVSALVAYIDGLEVNTVLAKLTSDPSTGTAQTSANAKLDTLHADLAHLTDGTTTTKSVPLTAEAAPAQVASSATAVTLAAANSSRRTLTIANDSTSVLYVKFGAGASATSYKVKLNAGDYYEMPLPAYQGIVTGIWASANGFAYVGEGS